jgi:putative tryptophan/tyrosine transport system substrate-binding protein
MRGPCNWLGRSWLALALVAVLLIAVPARSDSERVYRVGLLLNKHLADGADALTAELRRLGYVEGRNLLLDWRLVESADRNQVLAAELVSLRPDILLAAGTQQVEALKRATASIPIIFVNTGDPVSLHLVDSLPHPGGNITGIANYVPELAAKRLEMIGEVVPGARRIAMLFNPSNPLSVQTWSQTEAAARARSIDLVAAPARSAKELTGALQRVLDEKAAALIGASDILIMSHTPTIITFSARNRLPTMFAYPQDARLGGLMAYGSESGQSFRRAATYVDKILKGTKPQDLPVENPAIFTLVINLKTAKALGLTIPPTLLARADEVIE